MLAALGASTDAHAGVFDDPPDGAQVRLVSSAEGELHFTVNDVAVVLARSPGPDEHAPEPTCRANGYDLRAPRDLDPVVHQAVERACASLRARAPIDVPVPKPSPWGPPSDEMVGMLRALAVAWFALTLWALPRRVEPWAWGLFALAVRFVVAPPHILMSVGYPYGALMTYAGTESPSLLYGAGWNAVLDVLRPLFGPHPDQLHLIHGLLSAWVAPCLWSVATHAGATPRVARVTALLAATLPLAVALGTTETLFVLIAALHATALLGLSRGDRVGAALVAVSAGLLANVRPDQGVVVLTLLVALALTRRWGALLLALGPVAARGWELAHAPPGLLPVSELEQLATIGNPLFGRGSSIVVFDPTLTPFWLVPVAAFGAWRLIRRPRTRSLGLAAIALLLAGTAPYVGLHRYTDTSRFQLPTMVTWALLAGLAWEPIAARSMAVRAAATTVALLGLGLASGPFSPPLAHAVEHTFARAQLCALPVGARVRYDRARDPFNTMSHYFAAVCHVTLTAWGNDEPLQVGDRVWRGVGDRWHGERPATTCTLRADKIIETPPWDGGLEDLGQTPLPIGLFTVTACP